MRSRDKLLEENINLNTEIENIQTELEKKYNLKVKGAEIRSREKWIKLTLGEKNNSYFLGLEKQRLVKKSINKLKDDKNSEITDQSKLLHMIKEYYEKLYITPKPNKELLENYIFERNLDRNVNAEDFKISLRNVLNSDINMLKLNKSPGLGGLKVKFYQTFWDKSQDEKPLTYSQRTSVLSFI